MKVLTTLVLCLVFPVLLCAQSRRVGGTVVGDDAPLEAVSVCLLDADSSIVQFTQTDAAGRVTACWSSLPCCVPSPRAGRLISSTAWQAST